jgi:hypothetical protein
MTEKNALGANGGRWIMTLCEAPPNCCHLANEISRHFFLFLSFLRVLCVPPRILKGVLKRILCGENCLAFNCAV